jgi:hypothetical protein
MRKLLLVVALSAASLVAQSVGGGISQGGGGVGGSGTAISGTPASPQLAQWTDATHVKGLDKPAVDVRDTAGVDCTGATDSSSGLNTLFGSISGKKVVIPAGCTLQVQSQLLISGQTDFLIEGQGFQPNQVSNGPTIFGCSGAAGPVLYINRSSYYQLKNFGVIAKGSSCTSSFTGSIAWANNGAGGFTSTFAKFTGMAVASNMISTAISGYFGFGVGIGSAGTAVASTNLEQAVFEDNWVHCQNSASSKGIWMDGANADNGAAINNRFSGCFQAIRQDAGNLKLIEHNHFGADANFSVFGANGADIFVASCSSGGMTILANEASDGGPFLNQNNDTTATVCPMTLSGNYLGISDIAAAAYPINLGTGVNPYTLIGNQINLTATTTATVIGSSSQSSCGSGPLGQLVDVSNTIINLGNAAGWSGCNNGSAVIPFQGGEYHNSSPLGSGTVSAEGSAPTAAAKSDTLWADATGHRWEMNNNGGGAFYVPGIAAAGTNGNCVKLAANGIDLVDAGAACNAAAAVYPTKVASLDFTAQSANLGSATAYAVPSNGAGTYRISCYVVVTQAATTSSTLPNCTLGWTDADSSTVLSAFSAQVSASGVTGNTIGTNSSSGANHTQNGTGIVIQAKASTNITYATNAYASSGATAMQYALHLKVEYLGP